MTDLAMQTCCWLPCIITRKASEGGFEIRPHNTAAEIMFRRIARLGISMIV